MSSDTTSGFVPIFHSDAVTPSQSEKLLIDISELARLTSLSIRTLRRMDASRDIPGRVVVRRCVRFRSEIIFQWVRAGLPDGEQWAEMQKQTLSGWK